MIVRLTLCLLVCSLFPARAAADIGSAREMLYAGDLDGALAELAVTERDLEALRPCPADAWQELHMLRAGVLLKLSRRDEATAAVRAALAVTGAIDLERPQYWPSLRALVRAQRNVEVAPPPSCVAAEPAAEPALAPAVVSPVADVSRPAPSARQRDELGIRIGAGLAVAGSKISQGAGPNSTGAMTDSSMSGLGSGGALGVSLGPRDGAGVVAELRAQWLDLASAEARTPDGAVYVEAGWMAASTLDVGYQLPLPGRLTLEAGVSAATTHLSPGDSARVMAVTSSTRGSIGPHGALRWSIGERLRFRATGGMSLVSRWLDAPGDDDMTPLPPEMFWLHAAIDVRISGNWYAAANIGYSVSEWAVVGADASGAPPSWMIDEAQSLSLLLGRAL